MSKMGRMLNNNMKKRVSEMNRNAMSSIAPNLLPGVMPEDLREISCTECGGEVFIPGSMIKFASPFQSRNGRPTVVQFPVGFVCVNCQGVNTFKLPGEEPATPQQEENTLGISVSEKVKSDEQIG